MSCKKFNPVRCIAGLLGAVILLLCTSLPVQSQPVDTGQIVIMFADFEGPDPEGIPVTETIFSWIQQVGSEEGIFRVIRMDEAIEITETFETTFERALDEGADLVIYGVYDLPGTHVRIVVGVACCSGSQYGETIQIPFDREGTFPISELVPESEVPGRIRALFYFLAGVTYVSQEELELGLEYFDKTLEYEDSAPVELIASAYSLRSFVNFMWRKDALSALSDANRAIDMDPENPIHYTYRGACHEMMGELQTALDDYLIVNELTPSDPENLYNMSLLYKDLGDYYSAIDAINVAISLVPGDACYLNTRGCVYNYMEEYQAAVEDISAALELNPEYPTGWANLACAERELGNLTEAISCFSNAIGYQTDTALIASYLFDRGFCHGKLEDYDSAISDYSSALELCPGTASQYSDFGWALMKVENYEDAVHYYDLALQIDGNNPGYLCNRGICNYNVGETAESIEDLTAFLHLDPDGFDSYEMLGRAYADEGDLSSAIECFTDGLDRETEPQARSWFLSDRARCHRLAGDLEPALVDLTEATRIHSSEPFFHFRLGEVYYLMNLDDEAIECYNDAMDTGLTSDYLSACMFQRGRSHLIKENYDQAAEDLTLALENDPGLCDAYFFRGLAYYRIGEFDSCREDMEHFLEVGTDPRFTADARSILRSIE